MGHRTVAGGHDGHSPIQQFESKKLQPLEKPPGEWNHYEIRAQGENVTLRINGQEANRATGCLPRSGRICLTAEVDPYEFRNVRRTVLGGK